MGRDPASAGARRCVWRAALSFESFAGRRRREGFLEPQQYRAGDVNAAGGAERQRKVASHRPQKCAGMCSHILEISPADGVTSYVGRRQRLRRGAVDRAACFIRIDEACATEYALGRDMAPTLPKDIVSTP